MSIARSRITAQGQISIPAKVRQKLGVGPGSILIWDEEKGRIVVHQEGTYSFADIHAAIFPAAPPKRRSLKELKDGVRKHIRKRHERN
jgi:AbrB family looped-hinge helix DNA binding protein